MKKSDGRLARKAAEVRRLIDDFPAEGYQEDLYVDVGALDREWALAHLLGVWSSYNRNSEKPNCRDISQSSMNIHNRECVKESMIRVALHSNGSRRSNGILSALVLKTREELLCSFEENAQYWPSTGGQLLIRGSDLPMAIDAQFLVKNLTNISIPKLTQIILGNLTWREAFSGTDAVHLAQIPEGKFGDSVARGLYARCLMMFCVMLNSVKSIMSDSQVDGVDGHDVISITPNAIYAMIYDNFDQAPIVDADYVRDELLYIPASATDSPLTHPVVEWDGKFWTSGYLLADSIAPWLHLKILQNLDYQERVLAEPFESLVVKSMLDANYCAGEVEHPGGSWKLPTGSVKIEGLGDLPGQIDVLAASPFDEKLPSPLNGEFLSFDTILVIECKSLSPLANFKNISEKVGQDDHEFRRKVAAKADVIQRQFPRANVYPFIVVEGVRPGVWGELKREVPMIHWKDFSEVALFLSENTL
ncbi:hypothetical protein MUG60_12065 [Kaistella montana]|nr:hypothetical protein [Kaistella montana]